MIYFNLYRFGFDETPIGELINGDIPADDEVRWKTVSVAEYRIRKLFDEHRRAQAALRDCRETGRPFLLFLRSFAAEYTGERFETNVTAGVSLDTARLHDSLVEAAAQSFVPVVRLHGGSDGHLSGMDPDANVLSTHEENWESVAGELVAAAGAIVFLISRLTPGVVTEIERIRGLGLQDRTFLALFDEPNDTGNRRSDLREQLVDFTWIFDTVAGGEGAAYPQEMLTALADCLDGATCDGPVEAALAAKFTYLEPGFARSEDYAETQSFVWSNLRQFRVLFEDSYWAALKRYGIAVAGLEFPAVWTALHKVYGLAVATEDFDAMSESLIYIGRLNLMRNADLALLPEMLSATIRTLGEEIHGGRAPDTEGVCFDEPCLLSYPRRIEYATGIFQKALAERNPELANHLCHVAMIMALGDLDGGDAAVRSKAGQFCGLWASMQSRMGIKAWTLINSRLAIAIFREGYESDPAAFSSDLAIGLSNLGTFLMNYGDRFGAAEVYGEAVELRRQLSAFTQEETVNLYNSLANLGYLRVEMGDPVTALQAYEEALEICERHVAAAPVAIADLVRIQSWTGLALAKIGGRQEEARAMVGSAKLNLVRVEADAPEFANALAKLVAGAENECHPDPAG